MHMLSPFRNGSNSGISPFLMGSRQQTDQQLIENDIMPTKARPFHTGCWKLDNSSMAIALHMTLSSLVVLISL